MIASGALALALGADLVIGDPRSPWHPVRMMGAAATAYETQARQWKLGLKLSGLGLALGLPALVALLASLLLSLAQGPFKLLLSAVLVWASISVRDMLAHAWAVLKPLVDGDLAGAREALAQIVGRDVEGLDEEGLRRACIESVAESLCDGVLAPLFWATLLGAPAALAYRAMNTLDSMVGHKNARYQDFGWASAKLDDLANWVPARLSALLISLAALLSRLNGIRAWRCAWSQASTQASPNAGWPEAAFAGALGLRLAGPCSYAGELVDKPYLDGGSQPADADACLKALWLFIVSVLLGVALGECTIWIATNM